MPRYYFNTRIGNDLITDDAGVVLRDPDQAWEVARMTIRDLIKAKGAEPNLLNASLEVTDAGGEIVLEFPFSEALLDVEAPRATRH